METSIFRRRHRHLQLIAAFLLGIGAASLWHSQSLQSSAKKVCTQLELPPLPEDAFLTLASDSIQGNTRHLILTLSAPVEVLDPWLDLTDDWQNSPPQEVRSFHLIESPEGHRATLVLELAEPKARRLSTFRTILEERARQF